MKRASGADFRFGADWSRCIQPDTDYYTDTRISGLAPVEIRASVAKSVSGAAYRKLTQKVNAAGI
jgi:hypothetical protein